MRSKALTVSVVILLMVLSASAHDLFLKLDSYFLAPNAEWHFSVERWNSQT